MNSTKPKGRGLFFMEDMFPYLLWGACSLVMLYLFSAYLVLPLILRTEEQQVSCKNPTTMTVFHAPGDPINVAFFATKDELVNAMEAAGWTRADHRNVGSDFKMFTSTLFGRPDPSAPVSDLFLFNRSEDLAFEKEVDNPRQRHHVRLWQTSLVGAKEKPFWLGAATFDASLELSRMTGQLTHHISPDLDAERSMLFDDLTRAKVVSWQGLLPLRASPEVGENGGGDPYFSDGLLAVAILI
jgi:hypothetical protein